MQYHLKYSADKGINIDFPCFITVPSSFNRGTDTLPMIVFLHGAGERGSDIESVRVHGIPKLFGSDENYRGLSVITLSPQCPGGMVWNHLVFELKELIDRVSADYNADPRRISITGISMGGFGTWEMGMTFPGYFSALAPICGGGLSWRAPVLRDTPIRAYHGDADSVVPVMYSKEMIRVIENAGGRPSLTIYPGVGHDCWTLAYETTDLIEWLVSQRKK